MKQVYIVYQKIAVFYQKKKHKKFELGHFLLEEKKSKENTSSNKKQYK